MTRPPARGGRRRWRGRVLREGGRAGSQRLRSGAPPQGEGRVPQKSIPKKLGRDGVMPYDPTST